MRVIFLLVLVVGLTQLRAQPGVFVAPQSLQAPYWDFLNPQGASFNGGFGAGIQYQIPLVKDELILLPGLSYAYFWKITGNTGKNQAHQLLARTSLRFFPLDWVLPCDCPLYKQGVFAEGFAGWSRWDLTHREVDIQIEDVAFASVLGLAAGFSLKYGPNLTMTPIFRYSFFPSVTWDGLQALRTPETDPFFREETFIRQMSFEIHFLFGS